MGNRFTGWLSGTDLENRFTGLSGTDLENRFTDSVYRVGCKTNFQIDLYTEKGMTLKNELFLTLKSDQFPLFFPLLQQGITLKTRVGCTVRDMLCKDCGINPEYVEDRIKTIFLDGKPVDDIDSAIVRDGSTVAISAAMPGLVGSTFRRGGHLAAFRSTITHQEEVAPESSDKAGTVILKLFNLLVRELGPALLEKGFWIKPNKLRDILGENLQGCKFDIKDGKEASPDDLDRLGEAELMLKVYMAK